MCVLCVRCACVFVCLCGGVRKEEQKVGFGKLEWHVMGVLVCVYVWSRLDTLYIHPYIHV